jgi:type I restriction enzyme S subunit
MNDWPTKLLGEVCAINPKLLASEAPAADAEVTFVPMAAVNEISGNIARPEIRKYSQVTKGYTPFRENDVLFAKITPCMENGKAAIARGLRGGLGFGSTEFHVIRPSALLSPEWVFALVRQPSFREAAKASFTGTAGQQRVPPNFLKTFPIPVPPLVEQERIVKLLDEADELRKLRAQADYRTDALIPALFHEMFGDPIKNPKGWKVCSFAEVGKLDRGRSKNRPRDEPSLYGGKYPFIQTGDVANSNGEITAYTQSYSEKGLAQSRMWPAGTLVITIAATIGKTAILTFPACFPDSMVGFIPGDRVIVDYVRPWLVTMESRLEEAAPQMAQKNINLKILSELTIPVPPLARQKEFAQRVTEIRELAASQATSRTRLDALFQSMLHRAFNGEL